MEKSWLCTTQLPYALTVSGICLVVYLLAGIVHSSLILLAVGTVLTVGTVFVIKMLGQRRERITSLKQRNS